MPRLYGAPSYSRPPRSIEVERPFDPDDLPLEAHRSGDDDDLLGELSAFADRRADAESSNLLKRVLLPFGFQASRPGR